MASTLPVLHLGVSIERAPEEVYEFLADPQNLPRWAAGLGGTVEQSGELWIVTTPEGPAEIRFAPANPLGVVDHTVRTSQGVEVYVPMRVVPNGGGSEVLFTLFRQPGMTEADFRRDAGLVERDLQALKVFLESRS